RVVHGRLTHNTGAYLDFTTSIAVSNVAPTGTISAPGSLGVGAAGSFTASTTDPSVADTRAGFVYAWNFGDGGTASTASASHAYAAAGTYTVTLTVSDKDGGQRTTTSSVNVTGSVTPGDYIYTPYDKIPNFGAHPTIVSARPGAWSDSNT